MNNLQSTQQTQIKQKRGKIKKKTSLNIPTDKTVESIKNLLNNKIDAIENSRKESSLKAYAQHYNSEIMAIHQKAIFLRQEIEALNGIIETQTNRMITLNTSGYSSNRYWNDLPKNIDEVQELNFLEITNKYTETLMENIHKEKEELIMRFNLGLATLQDIETFLNKYKT